MKEQNNFSSGAVALDGSSYLSPKRGMKRGTPSSPVAFSACLGALSPPPKLGPVASPSPKLGPIGKKLLEFLFSPDAKKTSSPPPKPEVSSPLPWSQVLALGSDNEPGKLAGNPETAGNSVEAVSHLPKPKVSSPLPTLPHVFVSDNEQTVPGQPYVLGQASSPQPKSTVSSPPPKASPTLSDLFESDDGPRWDDRAIAWLASASGECETTEYEPDHLDDTIDGITKRDLRKLMSWESEDLTDAQFKYWAQYCTL